MFINIFDINIGVKTPHLIDGRRWKIAKSSLNKSNMSQREAFWNYETYYLFSDMLKDVESQGYKYIDEKTGISTLDEFRKIIRICYLNDIKLNIVINPNHIRFLEVLKIVGLYDEWNNWKIELINIIEEESSRIEKDKFDIWDFSGYNSITTENLPTIRNKRSKMNYYYDVMHYKKEVGDVILQKAIKGNSSFLYNDFGIKLEKSNIDNHILNTTKLFEVWKRKHKEDIEEIYSLSIDDKNKNIVYSSFEQMF